MTQEQILAIIEKVKKGITVERSNLDLKREWWNLNTSEGHDEFLKDIASMANSQGGDSTIILGIDESGKVYNAELPEDEANIQSKHKDAIEPRVKLLINEFQIEGKTISVLTIPHSSERPHVVKKYHDFTNWIPVRFGSSTLTASRSDLDEMYQERYKSHTSDLHIRLYEDKLRWSHYKQFGGYSFLVRLTFDNYGGGAPDYIVKVVLHDVHGHWKSSYFMFEGLLLNQELRIEAHDRKQGIQVYVSAATPEESKKHRKMPSIPSDLILSIYARSGKTAHLPITSSSIIETKHSETQGDKIW